MKRGLAIWLSLLTMLTIAMAGPAQADTPRPVWVGVWRGTVGGAAVQVCLQHEDNQDFGAYYYLRHLGIISLGKLGAQPTWTEAPFSDKSAQGPLWHFSAVSASHLQGSWSRGAESLPFSLTRVATTSADATDTPCGSQTFSLPRFTRPVITTKPARLMGVAYTRVLVGPGKPFDNSGAETFQLSGTTPAIRRVNAMLYKPVLTGPDDVTYFTCSMAALGQNGLDGYATTTITPQIITANWLVLENAEGDDCGGVHPNSNVSYESWDLRQGIKINLYDWFTKAALTRTVEAPGTKDSYITVTFTAPFKALIDKAYPREDDDCADVLTQADTWAWDPHLTAKGIAFTPELPHVTQACADDAEIPFATLAPYLTPKGKDAMAAFLAEVRRAPPTGKS